MITSEQILDHCGITYRQLDYWVRQGYLHPRDRRKEGSGHPRDFSTGELAVAARMARLVDRGFNVKAAATIARVTPGVVNLGKGVVLSLEELTGDLLDPEFRSRERGGAEA